MAGRPHSYAGTSLLDETCDTVRGKCAIISTEDTHKNTHAKLSGPFFVHGLITKRTHVMSHNLSLCLFCCLRNCECDQWLCRKNMKKMKQKQFSYLIASTRLAFTTAWPCQSLSWRRNGLFMFILLFLPKLLGLAGCLIWNTVVQKVITLINDLVIVKKIISCMYGRTNAYMVLRTVRSGRDRESTPLVPMV